jgi:hypothetical protein
MLLEVEDSVLERRPRRRSRGRRSRLELIVSVLELEDRVSEVVVRVLVQQYVMSIYFVQLHLAGCSVAPWTPTTAAWQGPVAFRGRPRRAGLPALAAPNAQHIYTFTTNDGHTALLPVLHKTFVGRRSALLEW